MRGEMERVMECVEKRWRWMEGTAPSAAPAAAGGEEEEEGGRSSNEVLLVIELEEEGEEGNVERRRV